MDKSGWRGQQVSLISAVVLVIASTTVTSANRPSAFMKQLPNATVFASVLGKRRAEVEKRLGKPSWPAEKRKGIAFYHVRGCIGVAIEWKTNDRDSEMQFVGLGLVDQAATWQVALQRTGFSSVGARVIGDTLVNVIGVPPGYQVTWSKSSLVFVYAPDRALPQTPDAP